VIQELGSTDERNFDDDDRQRVDELAPKVAAFREETQNAWTRWRNCANARAKSGSKIPSRTSSGRLSTSGATSGSTLEELERACVHAKPVDEPVEAHLADLFDYFNWRLEGWDHYPVQASSS